nr:immunoglobulin heavy chain junction region [Mus musculus]
CASPTAQATWFAAW